jgi:hypothetical protein
MKNLLIPAAGQSKRFPDMKPKWMLTHPSGNMMFVEAICGLDLNEFDNIYIITLSKILDKYKGSREGIINNIFDKYNKKIKIIELENETKSQSQTVYESIKAYNIDGGILIKDSDGYFTGKDFNENCICYSDISEYNLRNPQNKSYITFDKQKLLLNIIEKQIISKYFSVGGYYFSNSKMFVETYENIKHLEEISEIYISNIINELILQDNNFFCKYVKNYEDWGTLKDWEEYKKNFKTFFIDIDGVIMKNGSRYFEPSWDKTDILVNNVNFINNLYKKYKCQIILTTSRSSLYKEKTIEQLNNNGIKYDHIVFDLYHTKRVIINDFSNTNKYPSCEAVNILRDEDNLEKYIND